MAASAVGWRTPGRPFPGTAGRGYYLDTEGNVPACTSPTPRALTRDAVWLPRRHECRSCTFCWPGVWRAAGRQDRAARAGLAEAVGDSAWREPPRPREVAVPGNKLSSAARPGGDLGISTATAGALIFAAADRTNPLWRPIPLLADWIDDLRLLPRMTWPSGVESLARARHRQPGGKSLLGARRARGDSQAARAGRPGGPAGGTPPPACGPGRLPPGARRPGGRREVPHAGGPWPCGTWAGLTLLGPRSLAGDHTAVAVGLYEQVRDWVAEQAPASLLDLYCGVGGSGSSPRPFRMPRPCWGSG